MAYLDGLFFVSLLAEFRDFLAKEQTESDVESCGIIEISSGQGALNNVGYNLINYAKLH